MKVAFYTLGCKVNLYETEVVMNLFKEHGYELIDFNERADIYVINTCTVTNTSDQKSRKIIRQAIKKNEEAIIVVMGCYSQLKKDIVANIEGVNIIVGTNDKTKIIDYVEEYLKNKQQLNKVYNLDNIPFENMELSHFETRTRAFVKIQDGCNNYCAYCIIPYTRGNIRSKDKNSVIKEVTKLVNNGYKEIVLTGIHTGHYGADLNNYDLSDLLTELTKIDGLERIRLSSIEITEINDKLLALLKVNEKIANHFHIPLQSGSDTILKAMNRKYDTTYFYDKVTKIRSIRPDISLTTDIIAGFPGETDEEFNKNYEFIQKCGFSGLHVFPYSKREGTKASTMTNQVDNKVKKYRVQELIKLSKKLEVNYMNKFINKELVIIPEIVEKEYVIGHTSNYLKVKIKGKNDDINQIIKVLVRDIEYPYMIGEKVEKL